MSKEDCFECVASEWGLCDAHLREHHTQMVDRVTALKGADTGVRARELATALADMMLSQATYLHTDVNFQLGMKYAIGQMLNAFDVPIPEAVDPIRLFAQMRRRGLVTPPTLDKDSATEM